MRVLTSASARQLFTAMVAIIVDYALIVWMHALDPGTTKTIKQVQKIGGQVVIEAFSSVAGAIAEAEAHI